MSEIAAMEILYEYVPAIMEWCEMYMKEEPTSGSGEIEFKRYTITGYLVKAADICTDTPPNPRPGDSCSTSCIAVTDVLDIEESIWSPR